MKAGVCGNVGMWKCGNSLILGHLDLGIQYLAFAYLVAPDQPQHDQLFSAKF